MAVGFKDTDYKYDRGGNVGLRGPAVTQYAVIDTGARDGGTAGGGSDTELQPGLVLGQLTADGQFTDFDYDGSDGSELESDVVILLEKVEDISTGDQRALVALNGAFNWDKLRWRTADDKTNFAREDCNFSFYNQN